MVLEAPALASRFATPLSIEAAKAKIASPGEKPSGPTDAMLPLVAWAVDVRR